jgi:hypothetical protein
VLHAAERRHSGSMAPLLITTRPDSKAGPGRDGATVRRGHSGSRLARAARLFAMRRTEGRYGRERDQASLTPTSRHRSRKDLSTSLPLYPRPHRRRPGAGKGAGAFPELNLGKTHLYTSPRAR